MSGFFLSLIALFLVLPRFGGEQKIASVHSVDLFSTYIAFIKSIGVHLSTSYQSKYAIMLIGNADAAAATSSIGSNSECSLQFMSKPSGLKWQTSANASSSDAAASSTVTELSYVGQELETDADAATSTAGSNGKGCPRRRLLSCRYIASNRSEWNL